MAGREEGGMTLIVKTVTRLTLGFILLYGIYITLNGGMSPGGGFAGGIIVALAFVHIMLAFGKTVSLRWLSSNMLRVVMSACALLFLFGTMMGSSKWMFNHEFVLPLCEMAVVGSGMLAIFMALVFLTKSDKDSE